MERCAVMVAASAPNGSVKNAAARMMVRNIEVWRFISELPSRRVAWAVGKLAPVNGEPVVAETSPPFTGAVQQNYWGETLRRRQTRRVSATLQACATAPRGRCGGSASRISET